MNTEAKKKVLDVLNNLEVVEEGSEGYILVENSSEVHEKLNALGVSSETINQYGDDETFCIIALAFTEDLATDFIEGQLVYNHTDSVLRDVGIERSEQDKNWGKQQHEAPIWLMIAQEELGEVAQAIQTQVLGWGKSTDESDLYKEIIQAAAVLVAFAEQVKEREVK